MCTRRVKTVAPPPVRQVGLPTTADGNAPALTATYDFVSVANMLNTKQIINYHKVLVSNTVHTSTGSGGNTDQFVGVLYETY